MGGCEDLTRLWRKMNIKRAAWHGTMGNGLQTIFLGILPAQDTDDAGHCLRASHVDALDACMRVGRAHNHGMQLPGFVHVIAELTTSRQQPQILLALDRVANFRGCRTSPQRRHCLLFPCAVTMRGPAFFIAHFSRVALRAVSSSPTVGRLHDAGEICSIRDNDAGVTIPSGPPPGARLSLSGEPRGERIERHHPDHG